MEHIGPRQDLEADIVDWQLMQDYPRQDYLLYQNRNKLHRLKNNPNSDRAEIAALEEMVDSRRLLAEEAREANLKLQMEMELMWLEQGFWE